MDYELEAFQAGQMPLGIDNFTPYGLQAPTFQNPQMQHPAGPSSWTSDFQRMSLAPERQQQNFRPGSSQGQEARSWGQDYGQHFPQTVNRTQQQQGFGAQNFAPTPMSYMGRPQYGGGIGQLRSENMMAAQVAQQQQQQQPVEAFDDEAFARAFDEAAKGEFETEMTAAATVDLQGAMVDQETADDPSSLDYEEADLLQQPKIGSDVIYDSDIQMQNSPDQLDPDALARTAGQLLEGVANNHSSKFQNSVFLKLMQQFRDQEMVVEGDKIVAARTGHAGIEGDSMHEAGLATP